MWDIAQPDWISGSDVSMQRIDLICKGRSGQEEFIVDSFLLFQIPSEYRILKFYLLLSSRICEFMDREIVFTGQAAEFRFLMRTRFLALLLTTQPVINSPPAVK